MDRARIGRALLALSGHRATEIGDLPGADWAAIDRLAHEHRLRPFLHGRLSRGEIKHVPERIGEIWRNAYRTNAITILSQRRALLQATAALQAQGIHAVPLKGSALAWTVWPAPAERVMRDIDLLVPEEEAPRAYRTLIEAGWRAPTMSRDALETMAHEETHLPPLHSLEGVMCELHSHVWRNAPLPGSSMPRADDAEMFAGARDDERLGAPVPSAQDMLEHLVVHAACSHLLNVGPMALVDVDLWCDHEAPDWDEFWAQAKARQFDRPAALVFALVDRWRRPGFLASTKCRDTVDEAVLDDAELLLVQDLDARKDVSAIASLAGGSIRGRIGQHPLDRAENEAGLATRAGQVGGRALSITRSLLAGSTRRDGLATARLRKWLEG